MINQLLAGVHIAAAAEAMALGIRAGVDPKVLYEVITNSAGTSWMFQNRVPHILAGDYTPLSAVNIFVKDLGIVLEPARKSTFPLPLTAAAHQMFLMAAAAGHGGEDDAAVIKIFPGHRTASESMSKDANMLLGCIADDFTGATDLANMLVRGGMRTMQTIGVPAAPLDRRGGRRGGGAQVAHHPGAARPLRSRWRRSQWLSGPAAGSSTSSTARPSIRRRRATSARSPTR